VLGTIRDLALDMGAPLLARVERPVDVPKSDMTGLDNQEERATKQETLSDSPRLGSLVKLLILIIGLAVLWAVWSISHPSNDAEARAEVPVAVGPARAYGEPVDMASMDIEPAPPVWTAPAANYSVLVGSYIWLNDAEERSATLSADGSLFYVSPTPVRGRVYYRVFAGVHEDRLDALAAMEVLVADGRKRVAKLWDVRPVRLAYDLGTFDSLKGATGRIRALSADGIPAYVLRDSTEEPAYRVFAGAYESEEAATAMGDMLESSELSTELITRSGVAP
ncbi:MAG: SPOR domain-containing protein, partial [Gemmatimonadota bacterium]